MAATVIVSLLAWWFALGDSPVIHTTHVSLAQVVLTAGSVVSPPLITTVMAGLFLWWALSRRVWLSRAGTVLLLAGLALTGWDTAGGLHARAAGYSAATWDAVQVIGWAYVVVCVVAVVACIAYLIRLFAGRPRSAAGQPRRPGDRVRAILEPEPDCPEAPTRPLFAVTGCGSAGGGPALQAGPDLGDAAVQVIE
jgi:hypothetical protein